MTSGGAVALAVLMLATSGRAELPDRIDPLPANEALSAPDATEIYTAGLPGENQLAPGPGAFGGPQVEYAIIPGEMALASDVDDLNVVWESTRLSDYKGGFFQKLAFTTTWLEGGRAADIGLTELQFFGTVALPLPTADHPLLITPGFDIRYLHGPLVPDAPPRLYSGYLQFMWVPQITERLIGIFGATPGVYSDFRRSDNEELRYMARALARYDVIIDRLQVVAGVLYLDRGDFNLLPAGGIMWSPWDDVQLDLVFPIPRVAYRLSFDGRIERWVYLAGEFGGGSWSVQRADGSQDLLTLRDLRLSLGLERKREGGGGLRFELGYVFGRKLAYDSATPDLLLDDTIMLRARLAF